MKFFIGWLIFLFTMSPVVSTVCASEMAKAEQQHSSSHDHVSHHHDHSNSSHHHHTPEQGEHKQQCCGDQLWNSHTGFFKFLNGVKYGYSSGDDFSDGPYLSTSIFLSSLFQFPPGTSHLSKDAFSFSEHWSLFSQKVSLII